MTLHKLRVSDGDCHAHAVAQSHVWNYEQVALPLFHQLLHMVLKAVLKIQTLKLYR